LKNSQFCAIKALILSKTAQEAVFKV